VDRLHKQKNVQPHGRVGKRSGRFVLGAVVAIGIALQIVGSPSLCAPASQSQPLARSALIIGNGSYTGLPKLTNPLHDMEDMCASLSSLGFDSTCKQDLRDDGDFKAAIRGFASKLTQRSVAVFFYAGHAVQVNGQNYLVPTGAELKGEADVIEKAISLSFIYKQFAASNAYLNVIILDACRDARLFGGLQLGLAQITDAPRASIVLYATGAGDIAQDGRGRNGVLTQHLLAEIRKRGLTIAEMFARLSTGVEADSLSQTGYAQTPALYVTFNGNFCFAGCREAEQRVVPPPL
jgi:uncharacterized caspase-like protein